MKNIHGDTRNRVLELCMLLATLFGAAVAKADDRIGLERDRGRTRRSTNGQNPFVPRHDTRQSYNSLYLNP